MTIKKKERIKTTYNNQVYELSGRWQEYYVFSPIDEENDQCMMYSAGDIEELLATGEFVKVECQK